MLSDRLKYGVNYDPVTKIKEVVINDDLPIYIWGTGSVAVGVRNHLRHNNMIIDGYFTDIPSPFVDPRLGNICLTGYDQLPEKFGVVVGHSHYELAKKLIESDNRIRHIWTLPSVVRSDIHMSKEYIESNMSRLEKTYSMLADEISRNNMAYYLNAHLSGDVGDIISNFSREMNFFDNDVFILGTEERYFDAGAYDGSSIRQFIRTVKDQYDSILAVEVIPEVCRKLYSAFENEKRIIIRNIGLHSFDGRDHFVIDDQSTRVSGDADDIEYEVRRADKICKDEAFIPSIIKICIGGSITSILEGAAETIKTFMPRLAIAAGIDRAALVEYIPVIDKISGGGVYKYYLRFLNASTDRLTLFAVPNDLHN